jgi:uncharacterized damage-inducible protein DinB
MEQQFLETWDIFNRVHLFFLDAIAPETLNDTFKPGTRTAGEHLAHIVNVRLLWLKSGAPELLEGLEKIEKTDAADKARLERGFAESGQAIRALLEKGIAEGGKIKGFKPHASAFLGYLIAHEAYHIGKIEAILRHNGHPVDDKTHYGIWEWGVR